MQSQRSSSLTQCLGESKIKIYPEVKYNKAYALEYNQQTFLKAPNCKYCRVFEPGGESEYTM